MVAEIPEIGVAYIFFLETCTLLVVVVIVVVAAATVVKKKLTRCLSLITARPSIVG